MEVAISQARFPDVRILQKSGNLVKQAKLRGKGVIHIPDSHVTMYPQKDPLSCKSSV